MPPVKELHFFDGRFRLQRAADVLAGEHRSAKRGRGSDDSEARNHAFLQLALTYVAGHSDIEWYAKLFAMKDTLQSGDITPGYSTLGIGDARRIAARFPALKVLFLVRHPVDRLWSQFNHELRRGVGPGVSNLIDVANVRAFLDRPDVQARSFPTRIYNNWRQALPDSRIFAGLFDDLTSEPHTLRARILTFLGLDPASGNEVTLNRKGAQQKIEPTPEITQLLDEYFADEIEVAAELFGGAARGWRRKAN